METIKSALNVHKRKLVVTTHSQFYYLKEISFHMAARGSATSRCFILTFPKEGLMPDSTSVSANHRKQSQQITCRTHAQSSSPAVLSIENKSHIKAYGHPTQDVLLDCVILIVTDTRGHRQLSLWPPSSQTLSGQALCKFNMRTNKWELPSSRLVKVRFWAKNLYWLATPLLLADELR